MADSHTWQSGEVTISVDYDKCQGHAECVDVCPSEVYQLWDGKAVAVNVAECIECCACFESCPEQAITHSSCG